MEELVVGAQSTISGSSTPVQDTLDENAQIGGVGLRAGGRGLALDRDAQSGLLCIVDGDVQSEDLALLPRQQQALLAGSVHRLHLTRQFGRVGALLGPRFLTRD